jgi:membrane-bound inhibitor of C-type lysozyme
MDYRCGKEAPAMRAIAVILAPLLLTACASPWMHAGPALQPAPVVYSCEDGLTFSVRFARDGAHVTMPSGEEMLLPQQPSGSGIAYGTEQNQLRGKGDEATWTQGRRRPIGCRVQH